MLRASSNVKKRVIAACSVFFCFVSARTRAIGRQRVLCAVCRCGTTRLFSLQSDIRRRHPRSSKKYLRRVFYLHCAVSAARTESKTIVVARVPNDLVIRTTVLADQNGNKKNRRYTLSGRMMRSCHRMVNTEGNVPRIITCLTNRTISYAVDTVRQRGFSLPGLSPVQSRSWSKSTI